MRFTLKWSTLIHPAVPLLRLGRENMPATYEIDKQRRLVISTCLDPLTLTEGLAHQEKLLKDPDFDPSFSHLLDCTRVTFSGFASNDICKLAEARIFSLRARRAF